MDLLSEYNEMVLGGYMEGILHGKKIWIKSLENGNLAMYAPNHSFVDYRTVILHIDLSEMVPAVEVVGRVTQDGRNTFHMEVAQFREVDK